MGQTNSNRSNTNSSLQANNVDTYSYNTGGSTTTGQGLPAGSGPQVQDDGVSWWCKMLARTSCVVAGLIAMITGLFRIITFTPLCLVAGILLMLLGFFEVLLEAPCCCQFLDFIQPISQFSERRSYWQKALAYALPPLIPPLLCFSVTTMCGSALLMASGVIYGLIALGRKADRQTMITRARGRDVEMNSTLVTNEISPNPFSSTQ
ncbi:unnamed protein product [Candidula unifasciata]|uniref:Calcium channel flower n=1 Tax=Candidula unifasciata TaxID=100452 RepID=A0A8S3YYY8_9EUPU|nr:unnamed protein product [Candidula unifasciata]